MSDNHPKTNLNARDGAHNRNQAYKQSVWFSFVTFMLFVGIIGLLLSLIACQPVSAKPIATDDNSGYHSPTTTRSAAKPSRQPLAIFVSKTDLINTQQVTTDANNSMTSSKRYIYDIGHSAISYDGLSEPNKRPFLGNKFRRLNAVVNNPSPSFFVGDKVLTKRSGGYHA